MNVGNQGCNGQRLSLQRHLDFPIETTIPMLLLECVSTVAPHHVCLFAVPGGLAALERPLVMKSMYGFSRWWWFSHDSFND